jgi:hypothetical protein
MPDQTVELISQGPFFNVTAEQAGYIAQYVEVFQDEQEAFEYEALTLRLKPGVIRETSSSNGGNCCLLRFQPWLEPGLLLLLTQSLGPWRVWGPYISW